MAQLVALDPDTLRGEIRDPDRDATGIFLLRHTLMNPWLDDDVNGINYIELYCEYLERLIRETAGTLDSVTD